MTGPRVGHISPGSPLSLGRRLSAAVWKAGTGSRVWDRSGGACQGRGLVGLRGGSVRGLTPGWACPAEVGPCRGRGVSGGGGV